MTPEEEDAPAASRPAPMEEVRPQAGDRRHCGSGFELVLNATVPQIGEEVDVPGKFTTELARRFWAWMRAHDQGDGGEGGQVIAQEIPEVQVPPQVVRWRVQQRTVRFADAPVPQATSLVRISDRIH